MGILLKILLIKIFIAPLLNCYTVVRQKKHQFNNLTIQQFNFGFTLIELLVVIAIVGILVTGFAIAVNPIAQLQKSRDAKRIDALKQIKTALELYYQDYGRYPAHDPTTFQIVDAAEGLRPFGGEQAWGPYMQEIPTDPSSPGNSFIYYSETPASGGGPQTFRLYAHLDRPGNTCNPTNITEVCPGVGTKFSGTACGGACNYGVTSGNASP